MKILAGLGLVMLLLVAGAFGLAAYENARADRLQAQMAMQAQTSATASNWLAIAVLVGVILLLLAIIIGYVYVQVRPRPASRQVQRGERGVLGGVARTAAVEESGTAGLLEQMVQLQVLQMMRDMQRQPAQLTDDRWA